MGAASASWALADVAVPCPVDKLFTYRVPSELRERIRPGCRVIVPFGRGRATGYVVSVGSQAPAAVKLKAIASLVDEEPLITPALLDCARWMAGYYAHPLGETLRAVLPAGVRGAGRISPARPTSPNATRPLGRG